MKIQMNESPVSLPFKRERGVFLSSHGGGKAGQIVHCVACIQNTALLILSEFISTVASFSPSYQSFQYDTIISSSP